MDPHDVIDPVSRARFPSTILELKCHDLGDDGSKLAGCGRDSVGGRPVARREDLKRLSIQSDGC